MLLPSTLKRIEPDLLLLMAAVPVYILSISVVISVSLRSEARVTVKATPGSRVLMGKVVDMVVKYRSSYWDKSVWGEEFLEKK